MGLRHTWGTIRAETQDRSGQPESWVGLPVDSCQEVRERCFVASREKVRVSGVVTAGLEVGWSLAVARVSSSAKAWICRWTAGGLNEACWARSRRFGRALTSVWAIVRAYGVVAVSYFLVILAPSRTLEVSFCCG